MLDNLINLVKENAGDAIINNNAIPNENNDAAINSAANSIFDTLKSQASAGNLNGIMDMFKNNSASGELSKSMNSNVVSDLVKKFGIDNAAASGIASTLVPKVLESFTKKTNDPNDSSFDLQDIMKNIGGTGGLGDMMGGLGNLFK
jgi:uncharacterized protein YidB (DUF937 family)